MVVTCATELTDEYITLKIIHEEIFNYSVVISMFLLALYMVCYILNFKKIAIIRQNIIGIIVKLIIIFMCISAFGTFCLIFIDKKNDMFLPLIINNSSWSIKKDKVINSGIEILSNGDKATYIEIEGYDRKIYVSKGRKVRDSFLYDNDNEIEVYVIYDKDGNVRDVYKVNKNNIYAGNKKVEK
jgi:hypothetical protein